MQKSGFRPIVKLRIQTEVHVLFTCVGLQEHRGDLLHSLRAIGVETSKCSRDHLASLSSDTTTILAIEAIRIAHIECYS